MKHVLTAATVAITLGLALPAAAQLSSTTPTTAGTPGGTLTTEHARTVTSSQPVVSNNQTDIDAYNSAKMKKKKKASTSASGMNSGVSSSSTTSNGQ